MPGVGYREISLEWERSLRVLRNSQLTAYDEYKRMLRDIQSYMEEAKISASGGKSKRENDMRPYLYDSDDTYEKPFFSVLIKMLLEIVSMRNSQSQLEDLQRVHQWYVTNKTQLCKSRKKLGQSHVASKQLKYRPSSSLNPKSGILRHIQSTRDAQRWRRPQTSYTASDRGRMSSPDMNAAAEEANEKACLNIEGIDGVVPPDIPDDLNDYTHEPLKPRQVFSKRPDTAPPHAMIDVNSRAEKNLMKSRQGGSNEKDAMQSPVSKVSIHYNSTGEQRKSTQIPECLQSFEARQVSKTVRCRSANDTLHRFALFEDELPACEYQSEIDEDRVILDGDKVVQDARFEESRDEKSNEKFSDEVEEKVDDIDEFSHRARNSSFEEEPLAESAGEEKPAMHFDGNAISENGKETNPGNSTELACGQQNVDYIPSYSKFQKLKERKKLSQNGDDGRKFESSAQTTTYSSKHGPHRVAKTQLDRHSGLNKQGLSTHALLEMVTPIGQQMLEQKAPLQVSSEFRGDARPSAPNYPNSSPQDRLSPRRYLRPNAGMKTDLEKQKLKKAEIMFPEESPRTYKVHFPQEKAMKAEKHYKVSGPVEPDSIRYQYTQDGFGNKTYVKKLTRLGNNRRFDNTKTRPQAVAPQAVFQSKDPRMMNTKALASSMIIKHLGAPDRRSSDRMTGQSGVVPIWIASPDTDNVDTINYVKMTKPLEKDTSSSSGFSEIKRPKYHLRQLDVDIPVTLHSAATNTDGRTYHRERDHGVQGQNALSHNTIENARIDQNDTSKLEWLNQYNGGYFPLKAEGHAVQVGGKSAQVPAKKSHSHASQSSTPQVQAKVPSASRPGSHHAEIARTSSPLLNTSRPVSACSKTSSRLGSAHSKRSVRPSSRGQVGQAVEGVFDVNKFSHYCFDDNPSLEDDYQLQRNANAAVDIQRIFRGYMARKYARDLKFAEKERQKRAAVKIQSSMRGYLARKRLMEENLSQRSPQINVEGWEKHYKDHLKKKDNERAMKVQARSRQFTKLQVKQDEHVRKVSASKAIYDIFHDKGPTKAQMKIAAITIQRFVRGWLVRKFYQKAKEKAMKRTLDFNGFLKSYKAHIERIMERHGVKDPKAVLAFDELLDYIEKRNKYEIEYDRIANGKPKQDDRVFTYEDVRKFFEACGHHPSRKEIEDAINLAIEGIEEMKQHNYSKAQVVEIAFQIYVPKGTKLTDTRKSTWLNPIVDGDEAAMIKLSKKINDSTNLEKVFEFVSAAKREKIEMEQRAITPDLLPLDAKLNGFEKLKEKPASKGSGMKKKK